MIKSIYRFMLKDYNLFLGKANFMPFISTAMLRQPLDPRGYRFLSPETG